MVLGSITEVHRLPFPDSVREAINRLGSVGPGVEDPRIGTFVREFIFGSYSNQLEEIIVARVILEYYSDLQDLRQGTALFLRVFDLPISSGDKEDYSLLKKTVSMALGLGVGSILECAGLWIEKEAGSPRCVSLVQCLIKDYLVLNDSLDRLPELTPLLASSILSLCKSVHEDGPPPRAVEVYLSWITSFPSVVFMGGGSGSTKTNAPFVSLMNWAVLDCLKDKGSIRLHSALLNAMCEIKNGDSNFGIPSYQIVSTIRTLDSELKNNSNRNECLDRLGQLVHGLIAVDVISGNVKELKITLSKIKNPTRLLEIIVNSPD